MEKRYTTPSSATLRNWDRLHTQSEGRLTARANKRRSKKRVIPLEYVSDKGNLSFVQNLLDEIDENGFSIKNSLYSLGINLLKKRGLYGKLHVVETLSEYAHMEVIDGLTAIELPQNEFDFLGLVYQSHLQEGKKNCIGSYYTPQTVAQNMVQSFHLSENQKLLDPCCGSGVFLLSAQAEQPNQLFGVDNDEIAVMIARVNLLLKYSNFQFVPQIYHCDFLMGNSLFDSCPVFEHRFDYIVTNPPWGAMTDACHIGEITSKETFSYFFVKSHQLLSEGGEMRFLFPESVLNVKVHRDLRKYILEKIDLKAITIYDGMFSGVTTKYVDIDCGGSLKSPCYSVHAGSSTRIVSKQAVYETENLVFNVLDDEDIAIIHQVKKNGPYSLRESVWGLGIVTGDNKGVLSSVCHPNMEKIFTGKDIQPYSLKPATNYLLFDKGRLQQVAKDDIYRASEKLVYKFISKKLVFAYDNSASLFLNSANILIPHVPFMSTKTVMAFLNSSLYQFLYSKLFGEVKVLKGNLNELPFPKITKRQDDEISMIVDDILQGDTSKQSHVDEYICNLYGLNENQQRYIKYGKVD